MFFSSSNITHYQNLWFPTSENGNLESLYNDWVRCGKTLTINGESLKTILIKEGIRNEDGSTKEGGSRDEKLAKFVKDVIYKYILKNLPIEEDPTSAIKKYEGLVKKYQLEDIYKKPSSEFKKALFFRGDLTPQAKLDILALEKERQLTILDDVFPKDENNIEIRQHFRALNEIQRNLFQKSELDQINITLALRATEHGLRPIRSSANYLILTQDNVLTFSAEATIDKVINADEETPDSDKGLAQPVAKIISRYKMSVTTTDASFQPDTHTLTINSDEAKSLRALSQMEKVNEEVSLYIAQLQSQVRETAHSQYSLSDPLLVVSPLPISNKERKLKQSKIIVLEAAKDILRNEISLPEFCSIIDLYPNWNKGYSSQTLALVKSVLSTVGTSEENLKQTLSEQRAAVIEKKLNEEITELNHQEYPQAASDTLMQKITLKNILNVAVKYFKDECNADDLRNVMEPYPDWSKIYPETTETMEDAVKIIHEILEQKPLPSITPKI